MRSSESSLFRYHGVANNDVRVQDDNEQARAPSQAPTTRAPPVSSRLSEEEKEEEEEEEKKKLVRKCTHIRGRNKTGGESSARSCINQVQERSLRHGCAWVKFLLFLPDGPSKE